MLEKIKQYFRQIEKEAVPQLSINCVIFGFHEKKLQVVVNNIDVGASRLAVLPGGYVMQKEDVTAAVKRIVAESTGLRDMLFKQFAVFGDANRSFAAELDSLKALDAVDKTTFQWFAQRFVSICYLALVDFGKIELYPTQFLEAAQWMPVDETGVLAMDHAAVVASARESLLKQFPYTPIAANLLPEQFTLPELQALVEAILGRPTDRPNFRRKILKSGMLVKVGQDKSGKRRPADVYTFKNGKETSLIDEFRFGF